MVNLDGKPNIVFIITDQQRFDTINSMGFPYVDTPNLDRLVNEGISFTNCFVTAPSCAPSRASIFTGLYPHTTGITGNADIWRHSWVEKLAESGYYCVNIGKMHTYPYETPLGFHERFVVENKDRYLEGRYFFDRWDLALQAQGLIKQQREFYRQKEDYRERLGAFEWELPEKTHSDYFVGDLASWWIEQKPKTEPLFLQIGFPGPHPPYDPIPEYAKKYIDIDIPLPEVSQEELEAQPSALKKLNIHNCEVDHDSIYWTLKPSKEQLKRMRAYYMANVEMIDKKIGEIIDALDRKGYLENTVIIFTSDHGDCLGDHGHTQKWTMFDEVTRVPMIVWAPKLFKGGRKVDCLCQNFDIAPVIMELAGINTPDYWEAESLMPILKGESSDGRDYVFCEQARDQARLFGIIEQITMIRSKEWKLVHYLGTDDEGELYDLKNDPGEHNNLWKDSRYTAHKQELINELMKWLMRSNIRTSSWAVTWR